MSRKLLVIDDALIIREKIKDATRRCGWEIAGEAGNGQEAIARYNELRPDVVTLDLVMPDYDGLHALSGIMKIDANAQVLVVSALDQPHILKQALQLRAGDFILKPFDDSRLCSALEKLWARRAA